MIGVAYDEMASGQGSIRPHWREIMSSVWGMSLDVLREKQARAAVLLAGADSLLNDPSGGSAAQQWSIDILPLILPEADWNALAAGLTQRARLLNLILADIYGPQTLIRDGLLPPYLVYANPEFLRPLRHVSPAGNAPHLFFYAADLVRMPDGTWRILADRTQAAGGAGFALRHRSIVARTFPEVFRSVTARRLQPTFEMWQASLEEIGAAMSDNARIVLLTPGPHNSAFSEHVLLAHELGITLVQGSDLTVREDIVYLKTLSGLARVDVIYRRVDGSYCDPLELQPESTLGVAGLISAIRAGNVAVLNIPGSAVVETPAFAPFLPAIAERLIGEPLSLPAITTWWCGQRDPLAAVLGDLDRFALQPVFDPNPLPIDPTTLSDAGRSDLIAQVTATPEHYVASERVAHGLVPTLGRDGLEARPVFLRTCVIWKNGAWVAMPGGVARVAAPDDPYRAPLRNGGIVKDVWVLDQHSDPRRTTVTAGNAPETRKVQSVPEMLGSRAADDLFWFGRYIERLDSALRQFRALLQRLAGANPGPREAAELKLLATLLHHCGWISETAARAPIHSGIFADGIIAAARNPGPLAECRAALLQTGRSLRDRLSLDMVRAIEHLYRADQIQTADVDGLLARMDRGVTNIASLSGLIAENMTRGLGWLFLEMGRRIERGLSICETVDGLLAAGSPRIELIARLALELSDSTITYRRRYPTDHYTLFALDVVLFDSRNPRALLYQCQSLRTEVDAVIADKPTAAEPAIVNAIMAALRTDGIATSTPETLRAMLEETKAGLMTLSGSLTQNFFARVDPIRSLSSGARARRRSVS